MNPPKEYQFKPGQSGNPAGLPKGTRWMKTRLRELLEQGGLGDKVLDALINKAKDGDVQAIREILDRIDGKVAQGIEAEHTGGITIRFEEPPEYKRVYPTQDQGSIGDLDSDQ